MWVVGAIASPALGRLSDLFGRFPCYCFAKTVDLGSALVVATFGMVIRTIIAGIWVAFFQECQQ